MRGKTWIGIVLLLVFAASVIGYLIRSRELASSTASPYSLSLSRVITSIRQNELLGGVTVNHIRVIHMTNTSRDRFAFASFEVSGHSQYASLDISQKGTSMSLFSFGKDNKTPIRYVVLHGDGFEYVTGAVIDRPNMKSALLLFSNGTVVSVPVVGGYFCCLHKIGTTNARVSLKQVLGVTNHGNIVTNHV